MRTVVLCESDGKRFFFFFFVSTKDGAVEGKWVSVYRTQHIIIA